LRKIMHGPTSRAGCFGCRSLTIGSPDLPVSKITESAPDVSHVDP
jgi:hypothetical protein